MNENLVEVKDLIKTYDAPRNSSGVLAMATSTLGRGDQEEFASDVEQPSSTRHRVRAVDGLSFSIGRGEVVGLVGESGCGKSTVARCLLRLIEPDAGDILFRGNSIFAIRGRRLMRFRKEAQIVFQDPMASLDPRFTVKRTLAEPLRVHKIADSSERMRELLDVVGLREDHLERFPHQLSGGERQRVVIARALATEPRFLVLDEPTSALDASSKVGIIDLLLGLQAEFNMTYLVISHDLSIIRHLCERVIVMYLGRAMVVAPTSLMIEEPRHPYAEALISAIPIADPDVQPPRIRLRGDVSTATGSYRGCPLADRCHRAVEECHTRPQQLKPIGEGRLVACHRVSEGQI